MEQKLHTDFRACTEFDFTDLLDCSVPVTSARVKAGVAATEAPAQQHSACRCVVRFICVVYRGRNDKGARYAGSRRHQH